MKSITEVVQNLLKPYIDTKIQTLTNQQNLYFKDKTVTATSGTICTISDSSITASHVVTECVFSDPALVTSDVSWTTTAGTLTLTGTCLSITNLTVSVTLAKAGNI